METAKNGTLARLVMVSGSVVNADEVAGILSSYGYIEDSLTAHHYQHQIEVDCAIVISTDVETLEIFGNAQDHLNHINDMLQRFGWQDCALYSISEVIERLLLARLVNINIVTNEIVADLIGTAMVIQAPVLHTAINESSDHGSLDKANKLENGRNQGLASMNTEENGLCRFVEKHLLSKTNLDAAVLEDLRQIGYTVQVKLVRL